LNRSDLDDEAKAPAILAPNTDLARLIIQEAHGTYHRGVEHTISTVRQNYWISKIRQQPRKLVHKCVKCRRFNGHPFAYPDATDLPERRVCRSPCLNSRSLTYQGAEREDLVSVRPADFLQKDFNITLPQKWTAKLFEDDAAYLPPEEMRALQTRQEVLDALEKSCEATEKFWRIWTDQYLTSLRETHKKSLTDRRHTHLTPKTGDIVLLCDPVIPRNDWRMARITGTKTSNDGAIREVELVTSTRRRIRRPVNLITPLEITASEPETSTTNEIEHEQAANNQ
uniref:DUF5641 domain-containing protein n=1 Tax=Heligmosomoides polygyrus TaxID=6339 RepID=A0A183FZG4_HELPZ